jgi:hypothetical protein
MTGSTLPWDRGGEQDNRRGLGQESDQTRSGGQRKVFRHLQADRQVKPTSQGHWARQIHRDETLRWDPQRGAVHVVTIDAKVVRHAEFSESGEPGPDSAAYIEDGTRLHQVSHDRRDGASRPQRAVRLSGVEAGAIGASGFHESTQLSDAASLQGRSLAGSRPCNRVPSRTAARSATPA